MSRIAGLLVVERRTGERILPNERGDCLYVSSGEPELRHLCRGTEFGRVRDPVRNPFLVELLARFLQVRAHLLDFLNQIVAAAFERFALCIHAADLDGQIRRLPIKSLGSCVVRGIVAEFLEAWDFLLVVTFRLLDRHDPLARADELFVLIVETVEAMAPDTAFGAV
jgi:hypothetical protein